MNAYPEATRWLCDLIEDDVVDGELMFSSAHLPPATFAHLWLYNCPEVNAVQPEQSRVWYEVSDRSGYFLAAEAKGSREVFDAVSQLCASNVLENKELPFPLRYFCYQNLIGEFPVPKLGHRPKKKDWFHKAFRYSLVLMASEKYRLFQTRNDTADESSSAVSACDAAAEALTVCGIPTKYSDLKKLCAHPDHKKFRAEFKWMIAVTEEKG